MDFYQRICSLCNSQFVHSDAQKKAVETLIQVNILFFRISAEEIETEKIHVEHR